MGSPPPTGPIGPTAPSTLPPLTSAELTAALQPIVDALTNMPTTLQPVLDALKTGNLDLAQTTLENSFAGIATATYGGTRQLRDVVSAVVASAKTDKVVLQDLIKVMSKEVDVTKFVEKNREAIAQAGITLEGTKEKNRHLEETRKQTEQIRRQTAEDTLDANKETNRHAYAATQQTHDNTQRRLQDSQNRLDQAAWRNQIPTLMTQVTGTNPTPEVMFAFNAIMNRREPYKPVDLAATIAEVTSKCPGITEGQLSTIVIALGADKIDSERVELDRQRESNRSMEAMFGTYAARAGHDLDMATLTDETRLATQRQTDRQTNLNSMFGMYGLLHASGKGPNMKQIQALGVAMDKA